ncbi:MAG: ABC transporter ATP-binding protein, partial [Leuconostoc falkenbergense]
SNFDGAVITVSHDRYFLDKVANQLYMYEGKGVVNRFDGLFSAYLATHETVNQVKVNKPKPIIVNQSTKKKLTYNEKKEWETIETDIEKLENRINEIPDEMATFGTDYVKLGDLQQELDQLNENLENKMDRWEYLSDIVENS